MQDAFVRDRLLGTTARVSVATGGAQVTGGPSDGATVSGDGRYVAFRSGATDLLGVGKDGNGVGDVFVHDRLTNTTDRVDLTADGSAAFGGFTALAQIAADGRSVVFDRDGNVFLRGPDPTDPFGIDTLLFQDGALDDTVLEVFEPATQVMTTLCPTGDVAVANGKAAFLRPESVTGTARCPGGSLNTADADVKDQVVQLFAGGSTLLNLGRAATAVALSSDILAALVSEAGDGATDYNSDGDMTDTVLQVHPVGPGSWTNVEEAGDTLAAAGSVVAFLTPEAAQGADRNGDGDKADRVLQLWDAAVPQLVRVGQAAEEFVLGDRQVAACGERQLVAFRTREAAQGAGSLNGDGDTADDVLQVYDVVMRTLFTPRQAVTPCRLDACDPRTPYRVSGSRVTFLTLEADQGKDLDGDGSIGDLVLQVFDACTGVVTTIGPVSTDGNVTSDPLETREESRVFAAPSGRCAVLPAASCDPATDTCAAGTFCNPVTARCALLAPPTCGATTACPPDAECVPQVVTVATTVGDRDEDGVPDDFDDCPDVPDPQQIDSDQDGVGDACDATPCGDGVSEQCGTTNGCSDLIDNDGDGRVDCDDSDCTCQLFGEDPGAIIFRSTPPDHDFFKVHGRLVLSDPTSLRGKFGILLSNANGEIYKGVLQPGDLQPRGSAFLFVDRSAKTGPGMRGGLYKVKVRNRGTYVTVEVKAYSNLREATLPLMSVQAVIGDENAYYQTGWLERRNGWQLKLPPN